MIHIDEYPQWHDYPEETPPMGNRYDGDKWSCDVFVKIKNMDLPVMAALYVADKNPLPLDPAHDYWYSKQLSKSILKEDVTSWCKLPEYKTNNTNKRNIINIDEYSWALKNIANTLRLCWNNIEHDTCLGRDINQARVLIHKIQHSQPLNGHERFENFNDITT